MYTEIQYSLWFFGTKKDIMSKDRSENTDVSCA